MENYELPVYDFEGRAYGEVSGQRMSDYDAIIWDEKELPIIRDALDDLLDEVEEIPEELPVVETLGGLVCIVEDY